MTSAGGLCSDVAVTTVLPHRLWPRTSARLPSVTAESACVWLGRLLHLSFSPHSLKGFKLGVDNFLVQNLSPPSEVEFIELFFISCSRAATTWLKQGSYQDVITSEYSFFFFFLHTWACVRTHTHLLIKSLSCRKSVQTSD